MTSGLSSEKVPATWLSQGRVVTRWATLSCGLGSMPLNTVGVTLHAGWSAWLVGWGAA